MSEEKISNYEIIKKMDDFLREINEQRKQDGEEALIKSHVLIHKDKPNDSIIAVMENYETIIYRPLSTDKGAYTPYYNEPDDVLLEYLESGYELVEMSMLMHASLWGYISDDGVENIEYQQGFQKYLEYCLIHGISSEKLQEQYSYPYKDLLSYYEANGTEDLFMRIENFKDEPWYDDIVVYSRIGICKLKHENAPAICSALKSLGYDVRLKTKDGELYVLPLKDKKREEREER